MSAKTLGTLYETLTPEERTGLAFAAAARGDETELKRIYHAAPLESWLLPDDWRMSRAITFCAMMHRAEQLELVANYWFATGHLIEDSRDLADDELNPWLVMAMSCAYKYCVNSEAFGQFCEELGICVSDLLHGMPGKHLIELADRGMTVVAPAPDEVTDMLRSVGHDVQDDVATVAVVLENLRSCYRELSGG